MLWRRRRATVHHHHRDTRAPPPPEGPFLTVLQNLKGIDNALLAWFSSGAVAAYTSSQGGDTQGVGALKAMVADMFTPQLRNVSDILSLRSVYDLEDYQVGMLFGTLLGCVGCYHMWKAAPSVFVDAALAYGFYKLCVVSSELRRQGKCNDLLARLKFGIVVIMATRDFRKSYELMDFIKIPVFSLYLSTFIFDVGNMKKYAKHYLILTINMLTTKGGLEELLRIMIDPGYPSAYYDCICRK